MAAPPILSVSKRGGPVKAYLLDQSLLDKNLVLGRSPDCALFLDDPSVSRHHAEIRKVEGGMQIEKRSEFAPLVINGIDLSRAILKPGDLISLGPFAIRFELGLEKPDLERHGSENQAALDTFNSGNPNSESILAPNEFGEQPASDGAQQGSDSPSNDSAGSASGGAGAIPEFISDDGKTTLTSLDTLEVQLVFEPHQANVELYLIKSDQIAIGRGKDCEVILNDKKASRRNSTIHRAGTQFTIKDLGSINGTFVNGESIQATELQDNDRIQIGDTQFRFRVLSAQYRDQAKDLVSPPPEIAHEEGLEQDGVASASSQEIGNALSPQGQAKVSDALAAGAPAGATSSGISGIAGIGASAKSKASLIERFKTLPKRTQMIAAVAGLLFVLWLNEDDDSPVPKKAGGKKPNPKASGVAVVDKNSGPANFDALNPTQKKFIESQHTLAFDYYKTREYDKAIFEIQKIFALVPDYKDAKEIERYAKEGKRKMDAIEEERRKKEEEARLKEKIASSVDQAKKLMAAKDYTRARDMFSDILSLDPDNQTVVAWNKEIDAYNDDIKVKQQQKQVQEEINKQGQIFLQEGLSLRKKQKFYAAIDSFQKVVDIGSADQALLKNAKKMIAASKAGIAAQREPVLEEAKQAEKQGDQSKAYHLFEKATHIDYKHPAGYAGMHRVRKFLHDQAKVIYTDGIIAESYSDFALAEKKFQECVKVAPTSDIYYERSMRKLSHYLKKAGEAPS